MPPCNYNPFFFDYLPVWGLSHRYYMYISYGCSAPRWNKSFTFSPIYSLWARRSQLAKGSRNGIYIFSYFYLNWFLLCQLLVRSVTRPLRYVSTNVDSPTSYYLRQISAHEIHSSVIAPNECHNSVLPGLSSSQTCNASIIKSRLLNFLVRGDTSLIRIEDSWAANLINCLIRKYFVTPWLEQYWYLGWSVRITTINI